MPSKIASPRKRTSSPKKKSTLCAVAKAKCKGTTKSGKPCSRRPSCRLGCVLYCYQHAKVYVKGKTCGDIAKKTHTAVINRSLKNYVSRWRITPKEKLSPVQTKTDKIALKWFAKYRASKNLKTTLTKLTDYMQSLDQSSKNDFADYTYNYDREINGHLRDGLDNAPPSIVNSVKRMTDAIKGAPALDKPLEVWRGDTYLAGQSLKVGDHVQFMSKNFISTSLKQRLATGFMMKQNPEPDENKMTTFCCLYRIILPETSKVMYLYSVSKVMFGQNEQEILLPPGSKFLVISSKMENLGLNWTTGYQGRKMVHTLLYLDK